MKNNLKLETEPIPNLVKSLAFPAITGMLVNAVYNIVDTFFVGKLNDPYALGAVSIAFPTIMIITAVALTLG
ncbi:MAG: MATE family efflux transporter, partial [Fusobacterium sp.]